MNPVVTPPEKNNNVLLDILDQIEACKNATTPCDEQELGRIKQSFVSHMTLLMGGAYSFTYSKTIPALFDILIAPPSITQMIVVFRDLITTYLINAMFSFAGGIPGVGELNAVYISIRQMFAAYPIFFRIIRILPIGSVDGFLAYSNAKDFTGLLDKYITYAIDKVATMKKLTEEQKAKLNEASSKFKASLSEFMTQVNELRTNKEPIESTEKEKSVGGNASRKKRNKKSYKKRKTKSYRKKHNRNKSSRGYTYKYK
jgi:hypothetical protein